jgi:hypothetical protein
MRNSITRLVARGGVLAAIAVTGIFCGTALSSSATPAPDRAEAIKSAAESGRGFTAPRRDLSTLPKIKRYLRSIGVSPRGVVVQLGLKNYAGPNCPGAAWNCTTARKVVQLSPNGVRDGGGGENRVVCTASTPKTSVTKGETATTQSCVIVQSNGTGSRFRNSATCDLRAQRSEGVFTQTCTIEQSGFRNSAVARQAATMSAAGTAQDLSQIISVKQLSGTGGNTLETSQGALVKSGPGSSSEAVQDVHQITCGNQDALGNGPNFVRSAQAQLLSARKNGATAGVDIAQNAGDLPAVCPGPATFTASPGDCAVPLFVPALSPAKESANACTRIHQDSGSGRNTIHLGQLDSLFAEVKNSSGSVGVQQGHPTIDKTGTDGTLTQDSTGLSQIFFNGLTTQVTNIDGTENVSFFTVDQTDTGPRCCGTGSPNQQTNPSNDFKSDERLIQRLFVNGALAGEGVADGFFNQTGQVKGDCETSGTPSAGGCVFSLFGSNNADPDGESNTCGAGQESSCHVLVRCEAAGGGDLITAQQAGFCQPETAPPDVTVSDATEPTPAPQG